MKRLPNLVLATFALLFLPLAASGTWSIVVVDTATGEVGLASATCINGYQLKKGAGVVVVGRGAGQIQADGDSGAFFRRVMFDGLKAGMSADEIMAEIEEAPIGIDGRQIGIVGLDPSAATFSGNQTVQWSGGRIGRIGTLHYAIQGNILACAKVVNRAKQALVQTEGDVATRIMAAMWEARNYGGDYRCSCISAEPAFGCGCPPDDMLRASSTAYLVVARMGDTDGNCNPGNGCANGEYYLDLEALEFDPVGSVPFLQEAFDEFRAARAGHADHLLSEKEIRGGPLLADGRSRAVLVVRLADIDGVALTSGGASLVVEHAETSAGSATIGDVVDRGDGTYAVELTAGSTAGTDLFEVRVDDGMGPVLLWPLPRLESVAPALRMEHGTGESLSGRPDLLLDGGTALAGRPYALFGDLGADLVPLGFGILDGDGAASHSLAVPPALRGVPGTLRVAWATLGPIDFVSNEVTLRY